jgi:hypothetical protein
MTIDRELIEDIESRIGLATHNLEALRERFWNHGGDWEYIPAVIEELQKAREQWLTLRTKLQAAGVVSNVGGS